MEKNQRRQILNSPGTRWLLGAVRGSKHCIVALAVLQALSGLGTIGFSLLFRELIDRAVAKNTPGFWLSMGLLAALAVLRVAIRAWIRHLDEHTAAKLENALKLRLFRALLGADYAGVTATHTGEWMNRLTSDTQVVARGLTQIIPQLTGMAVQMVGALTAILLLQPLFGGLILPAGALLMFFARLLRPKLKGMHRQIQEQDGRVRILLQERLDNLLIVDAYSRQESSAAMAEQRMQTHYRGRMKRNALVNLSQSGLALGMQGMYLLGALFCGHGILTGTISYGTMTAVLHMIGYLQTPFSAMGSYLNQWYSMVSSAERLMEAELLNRDDPREEKKENMTFTGLCGENLTFSYRENGKDYTIRYPDFSVAPGEFLAIAGPSGCGKSTLLKLMLAMYRPGSGSLTVSGEALTPGHRPLFAYVPQGNMLMSGTIREALAFHCQEHLERTEEMWEALCIACAEEFVSALPQGLDTPLGEHGAGLSEGQLQRLAVARALFSRRSVLLLDEATSALDEKTEEQLLRNLKTMTQATVVLITHRTRAFQVCDRVLKLEPETPLNGSENHDTQ